MIKSPATEMVKNYAAVNGTVRMTEVRQIMGITNEQVLYAFDNLKKQGHLRRVSHGLYQFVDTVEKPPIEVLDKIWRAMKISGSFSATEIAKLADSTTSYVYKRFRAYKADGFIREAGLRPTFGSGTEKLWRLTKDGKEKAQNPNIETWTPEPINLACLNLARLVCSGVAARSKEMALEALAQLEIVKKGLEDVIDEK